MFKFKTFLRSVLAFIAIAALVLIELWSHSSISKANMFSWKNISNLLMWLFGALVFATVVMVCLIIRYKKLSTTVGKEEAAKKIRYFFGDISEDDPSPKLVKWLRRNPTLGWRVVFYAIVLFILLFLFLISEPM